MSSVFFPVPLANVNQSSGANPQQSGLPLPNSSQPSPGAYHTQQVPYPTQPTGSNPANYSTPYYTPYPVQNTDNLTSSTPQGYVPPPSYDMISK